MRFLRFIRSDLVKSFSLFVLSVALLSAGFFSNSWHVANQKWFALNQRDAESLIAGRMVKSGQDGILSMGGLLGLGIPHGTDPPEWPSPRQAYAQYIAYLNGLTFDAYSPYLSQSGVQGMVFSFFDGIIPLTPQGRWRFFQMFTSLLSAMAITLVILWFYREVGLGAAIFVLLSAVFSPWLTVFGRNLWWSMWAFYFPMIVVMYFLRYYRVSTNTHLLALGICVFISIFVKCLVNGYEYITTTLIMMMVPLVYYGILKALSVRQFLKGTIVAGFSACLAIFASLTILCLQIAAVKGSFREGVAHIAYSLFKRTWGDGQRFAAAYTPSLEASTFKVVVTYLKGTFININDYLSTSNGFVSQSVFDIHYYTLIVFFLVMSILVLLRVESRSPEKNRQSSIALVVAAWFSILAPLSWYMVFKAHSFIHTHMNFIVWHMPFILYGFAVSGLAVSNLFSDLLRRGRPKRHFSSPSGKTGLA